MSEQVALDEPTPAAAKGTAADMVVMLRRHYLPDPRTPAGVFAPEIQTPDGSRRADLIWMPATIAGGAARGGKRIELWGHEVKVTRQDVLVELADPTKAEAWAQYCTRWWLVVLHPSLIDGLDVPLAWGVLAPPSGRRTRSLTVVRDAPELTPVNQAPALERLARWQLFKHRDEQFAATRERERAEQDATWLRRRLEDAEAGQLPPSPNARLVAAVVDALEKAGHRRPWMASEAQHVEAIARAVVATEQTAALAERAREHIEMLVRQVQSLADPFRNALGPLGELVKQAKAIEREVA